MKNWEIQVIKFGVQKNITSTFLQYKAAELYLIIRNHLPLV